MQNEIVETQLLKLIQTRSDSVSKIKNESQTKQNAAATTKNIANYDETGAHHFICATVGQEPSSASKRCWILHQMTRASSNTDTT